jgi:hypothetical protein
MFKRLSRLVLTVALAVSALTLADSPAQPVAIADAYGCGTQNIYHSGGNLETYNFTTVRGIKARLHYSGKIELCNGVSTSNNASAWVAVVPDSGMPEYGNTSAIIQVGLIRNNLYDSGNARFFWAIGGCDPLGPHPQMFSGWTHRTPGGWVDVEVNRNSGGTWTLTVKEESSGDTSFVNISSSDNAVSCWAWDNVRGQISSEMKNSFDTVGYADAKFNVRDLRFRASTGGTWWYPSQDTSTGVQMGYPQNCDFTSVVADDRGYDNDMHCDDPGSIGDKLDFWTTHVPL